MQQAGTQQQHLQQQNGSALSPHDGVATGLQSGGKRSQVSGGRFDFEDGGTYCGGWDEGKAHGHGVCTGPKHQGAYAGAWNYGFEVSGAYIWPSGSHYEGQWQNGRRHGLGVEQIGRQIYRGEWSKDGHKGRYGVRESTVSTAKYEGTWNLGYQDGYGCETYADGGKYQGQWQEGKRHGYGIRTSAPFGLASHHRRKTMHASVSSLRSNENGDPDKRGGHAEEIRGGFVLTAKSDKLPVRRNSLTEKSKKGFLSGLKMRKQRSTGDLEKRGTIASGSIRSTMSTASWISTGSEQSNLTIKSTHTESNASFTMDDEQLDPTVVESYMGEWKKDKRCGYGVAERSDGLKYEGEWYNNKKHGYGVTTFRDGTFEEGKYKNNILITSQKKKHLFLARSRKFRERITASVNSAQRALKMAMQRSDIAISRTATAASKAQNADVAAEQARIDCELAVQMAREFAPDFKPSVLERFEKLRSRERFKGSSFLPSETTVGIQKQQQQLSAAFPHQNRRQSHTTQVDSEFPVPSSMYSQQLPVSPQTDLSSLVSQPQSPHTTISAINQIYHQQQHQQLQQNHTSLHNNPQMNPAYQFQQHQPPGSLSQGGTGMGGGGGVSSLNKPSHNFGHNNVNTSPMMNQSFNENTTFKETEVTHTLNNMQMNQQLQQQQLQQQHLLLQQQQKQQSTMQQRNQTEFQQFQQQQQQQQSSIMTSSPQHNTTLTSARRQSQQQSDTGNRGDRPPMLGQTSQSSIDYFDHYKRPPSRDSSVNRYERAASRLSGIGSRQASVDRGATATPTADVNTTDTVRPRSGSVFRGSTPVPTSTPPLAGTPTTGNGVLPTGRLSRAATPSLQAHKSTAVNEALYSSPNQPFEDILLRQRTLGQDIIPSPLQPKRTESLYLPPKPATPLTGGATASGFGGKAGKKNLKMEWYPEEDEEDLMYSPALLARRASESWIVEPPVESVPINVSLQRKKSLPDFQELPRATEAMSREEVSALGSARREAVRRQIETNERLRANPLLYLVSPQVKDWFSRQQLTLLVLFVNIVLGLLFYKMLT